MIGSNGPVNPHLIEPFEAVDAREACRICRVRIELIEALVMEGVFDVNAHEPDAWRFNSAQLANLRKAARLYDDLGINPPGIALVLELLQLLEQRGR